MMSFPRPPWILSLLLVSLVTGLHGCASTPTEAIPDEVSVHIKTVGVMWARAAAPAELDNPPTGWTGGMMRGAFNGAVVGGGLCLVATGPGLLLLPACVLVGTPIGAVYGAFAAEPAQPWDDAEKALTSAFEDLRVQQTPGDLICRVSQLGTSWTRYSFVPLSEPTLSANTKAEVYRGLASQGIDTLLEMSALTVGFVHDELKINPDFRLHMSVHTQLIRIADGQVLDERDVASRAGRRRHITEWGTENAHVFREQYAHTYWRLSEAVVERLFLLYYIP